jgi:hypothetical protein
MHKTLTVERFKAGIYAFQAGHDVGSELQIVQQANPYAVIQSLLSKPRAAPELSVSLDDAMSLVDDLGGHVSGTRPSGCIAASSSRPGATSPSHGNGRGLG